MRQLVVPNNSKTSKKFLTNKARYDIIHTLKEASNKVQKVV